VTEAGWHRVVWVLVVAAVVAALLLTAVGGAG